MKKYLSLFFLVGPLNNAFGADEAPLQKEKFSFKQCHSLVCNKKNCEENRDLAEKCDKDCYRVPDCTKALKMHKRNELSKTAENAYNLRNNLSEGARVRLDNVSKGEGYQELGQSVMDKTNQYTDLVKNFGVSLSLDPAKSAQGKTLRSAAFATKILGNLIGAVIRGKGRKTIEEQIVESVDELLIRVVEKDFRDVQSLVEQIEKMSSKRAQLFTGESPSDKLKTVLSMDAWANTIKDVLDKTYLLNFKGDNEIQLSELRAQLVKKEAELKDHIDLFFIKVVEGQIKQVDEGLNPIPTIEKLQNDITFYDADSFEIKAFEEKVNFLKITMSEWQKASKKDSDAFKSLEITPEMINVDFVKKKIKYYKGNKVIEESKSDDEVEKLLDFLKKRYDAYTKENTFDPVVFYENYKKKNQRYDYKKESTLEKLNQLMSCTEEKDWESLIKEADSNIVKEAKELNEISDKIKQPPEESILQSLKKQEEYSLKHIGFLKKRKEKLEKLQVKHKEFKGESKKSADKAAQSVDKPAQCLSKETLKEQRKKLMEARTELINGTKYEDFYQGTGNRHHDKDKKLNAYEDLTPLQVMKRLQDLEKRVETLEGKKPNA